MRLNLPPPRLPSVALAEEDPSFSFSGVASLDISETFELSNVAVPEDGHTPYGHTP
jgi:hypothetical protein